MSTKSFYLTLVRHGETLANRRRIVQGHMDVKLSDEGKNQAVMLFNHWSTMNRKFDLIYSSDLIRALETARIIVGTNIQQGDIIVDERLRERGYGIKEGIPLHELRSAAKDSGYSEKNYSSYTPQGAESLDQVRDRIKMFCTDHLINVIDTGSKVLIVTHGGVIREFFRFFRDSMRCQLQTEMEPYRVTPNTGVSTFKILYRSGKLISAECIQIHDISHLAKSIENIHESSDNISIMKSSQNDDTVMNSCDLLSCPTLEAL